MTDTQWFVVQSNIKSEEKAAGNIKAAGIGVYFPSYRKEIIHHRTKKVITKVYPLFRRYLFIEMPVVNADWYKLRACEGVECVLGVNGTPIPVPSKAVEEFIAAQADLQFDETHTAKVHRGEIKRNRKEQIRSTFTPGKTVTINRGTFTGFSGHVASPKQGEQVKWNNKIDVMVELLGGLVPVSIPVEDISIGDIDYTNAA